MLPNGAPLPLAIRTLPLWSSTAMWLARGALRLPVALHCPVAGSYSSAAPVVTQQGLMTLMPPTTSTLPFASGVAVCRDRAVPSDPAALHACAFTCVTPARAQTRNVMLNGDVKLNRAFVSKRNKERK